MNLQSQALEARRETHLSRGIDHLGFIESKLRDLQGFATLAHELMQNADDAEGTTFMCFNISDEALIVDNDGVFSGCEHVEEPICSWKEDPSKQHLCDFHRFRLVASADKRIEEGTTGAFGIGFIAVYQEVATGFSMMKTTRTNESTSAMGAADVASIVFLVHAFSSPGPPILIVKYGRTSEPRPSLWKIGLLLLRN